MDEAIIIHFQSERSSDTVEICSVRRRTAWPLISGHPLATQAADTLFLLRHFSFLIKKYFHNFSCMESHKAIYITCVYNDSSNNLYIYKLLLT